MKLFLFAVHDSCSKVYDRPWVARSEGEAIRAFGDIASNADHPIGQHPEHYKLYRLGTFDDNKGVIDPEPPCHIANAQDLVRESQTIAPGALRKSAVAKAVESGLADGANGEDAASYGGTE